MILKTIFWVKENDLLRNYNDLGAHIMDLFSLQ